MSSKITLGLTGLDTDTIIQELAKVERRPLEVLEAKQDLLAQRKAAWESLTQRLNTLVSKITELTKPSTFTDRSVSVTNPEALSARVSGLAQVGTYAVNVISLARRQVLQSRDFVLESAQSEAGFEGTLHIKGLAIEVESTDSLSDIVQKVNEACEGFKASIVKVGAAGEGLSAYRIVLTSQNTGTAQALKAGDLGDDPPSLSLWRSMGFIDGEGLLNEAQGARDAVLTLSGVTITRAENRITDALEGVTVELHAVGESEISVGLDDEKLVSTLKGFVEEYNNLVDLAKRYTERDSGAKSGGLLLGDTLLLRLLQEIRGLIFHQVEGEDGDFRFVGQIGISTGALGSFSRDGKLSLDESKLKEALTENREGVAALIGVGEDGKGVFNRLKQAVERYTSADGFLPLRKRELENQDKDLARRIEDKQRIIDMRIEGLKKQFTALEMLVFKMNSQSAWLAQQVAGLFQV